MVTFFLVACGQSGKLYRNNKLETGSLTNSQLDSLKTFLTNSAFEPRDTIFIKFDFNHESCWEALDNQSDEYINRVVSNSQNSIRSKMANRPNVSIYQYKQSGKAFNKLKHWNTDIKTDSSGYIRKLLFKEKTACGTSAIITPGGKFLLIKSDSHFEAAYMTAEDVAKELR